MNHDPRDDEINRTIAEYMGLSPGRISSKIMDMSKPLEGLSWFLTPYTQSLDACILVIEKLLKEKPGSIWLNFSTASMSLADITIYNMVPKHEQPEEEWGDNTWDVKDKSPSRALSLAIYHVIKEME